MAVVELRARLLAGEGSPSPVELLAGLLAPYSPEAHLAVAEQVLAVGLQSWGGPESDRRAAAIGLKRNQVVRLRLLAALTTWATQERAAMPAPITGPADVLAHLGDIRGCHQERVVALYVDARNRPLGRETVSVGGLRSSVIQPRDVLAPALGMPAAGLILAHNHPSGDTRPSHEDIEVTTQLAAAAKLLGLELLDHLIVSKLAYTSLKELGVF